MITLPEYVFRVRAKGKDYFYFQPGRGTSGAAQRVRLPNDPHSAEFWQAYAKLSGREPEKQASGTFDALIEAYKASPEFKAKSDRTKKLNETHLSIISMAWGSQLVRGVRPRHVLELRDTFENTPRKADQIVALLSVIISWGIPRDFAEQNPCSHIGKLSKTDGYAPWSWPDIEHARENLPKHLWHAAALALYTGQRQSDVLKMDWSALKDGGVELRQGKTGKRLWLPLHRNLRLILDDIPKTSTRILTNSQNLPWASGFVASWQKAMNGQEFKSFRERRLVFHGLRKSAVVMLLEAGCTDAEVAAITGQTRDMVAHYSLMVNQRKLAAKAILKWEAANSS